MKRLVVCCDGTWNKATQPIPTNVLLMSRAIAPSAPDNVPQEVFYDQGVGTGNFWDKITGGGLGSGLDQNIRDAYLFLVNNYEEGDEVFLFGFSRGAYTARSTAGLIRKCGLLKKSDAGEIGPAYDLYRRRRDEIDGEKANDFRQKHSREIDIKFLGVWDTVGALGIPLNRLRWIYKIAFWTKNKYQFHDAELSGRVKNGYHALAIDEKRGSFKPVIWDYKPKEGQQVEQVWFAGVHSDVGGGGNEGLSDIALRWLIGRARHCGLVFDSSVTSQLVSGADPLVRMSLPWGLRLMYLFDLLLGGGNGQRSPGVKAPATEAVHSSAVVRHREASLRYSPKQLVTYLQSPVCRVADDSEIPRPTPA